MILIIDNYDSFSYNLYQMVGSLNSDVQVVRNNKLTLQNIEQQQPTHIILSPGPGRPKDAGICEAIVRHFKGKIPLLGVCLGHQAIGEACGASIGYAQTVMHGKQSTIHIANGNTLFCGLPPIIQAARYHSLAIIRNTLPDELLIIAEAENNEIMGIKHRDHEIYGIQFHPESILTPQGQIILQNFLAIGCDNA